MAEISYLHIRDYAERWTWIDPVTNVQREGLDPPSNAINLQHKPYHIVFLTKDGRRIEGDVITIRVRPYGASVLRDIKFISSGEVRMVDDQRIVSIDDVRFISH